MAISIHLVLLWPLLLLLALVPTPLLAQQGSSPSPSHDLRAFDLALKSIRASHGPFCSEGRRPTWEDCGREPPRPPWRNPYMSRPKPPLTLELVLSQRSAAQAAKLVVRRAWEGVLYEHPIYERECPTTSAPMWLIPDFTIEPYGRFWGDFKEVTRRLHEGEIRILDARAVQDACEWALRQLQAGIDAGLAYAYQKLLAAADAGRQLLVEGVLGRLWQGVKWSAHSMWGFVEWIGRSIVASVVSLWELLTTSIHFVLHATLAIARACVDVAIASLREVGKFVLWLMARMARGIVDAIVGGIEAVVGGVVAFGIWIKDSAAEARAAVYRLILDVVLSIWAFFLDVGRLIWEFVVDTVMTMQQAAVETWTAITTTARGAITSVIAGIHGAFRVVPVLVLPTEEAVERAVPWIIAFISVCWGVFMWWRIRQERQAQQQEQQLWEGQRGGRPGQQQPPPLLPPGPATPPAPSLGAEGRQQYTHEEVHAVRTVHMEATQSAPPRRVVVDARDEVVFAREGASTLAPAPEAPPRTPPAALAAEVPAQSQAAASAAEEAAPLPEQISEEPEAAKTSTRRSGLGTYVMPSPARSEAPHPLRSVASLFVRAVLGEDDADAAPLRESLGPTYWDGMVALYHEDFARRGILAAPRDLPPFEPDGRLSQQGVDYLLSPPESTVRVDKAWHLYGVLEEAGARMPGYTFVA